MRIKRGNKTIRKGRGKRRAFAGRVRVRGTGNPNPRARTAQHALKGSALTNSMSGHSSAIFANLGAIALHARHQLA